MERGLKFFILLIIMILRVRVKKVQILIVMWKSNILNCPNQFLIFNNRLFIVIVFSLILFGY